MEETDAEDRYMYIGDDLVDAPDLSALQANLPNANPLPRALKITLVGDAVGKSTLIMALAGQLGLKPVPEECEEVALERVVGGEHFKVALHDVSTQLCSAKRAQRYANTDVFVLCFSVVNKQSLRRLTSLWEPELRSVAQGVRVVLVATHIDLRGHPKHKKALKTADGQALASTLGMEYVEVSGTAMDVEKLEQLVMRPLLQGSGLPFKALAKASLTKRNTCTIL